MNKKLTWSLSGAGVLLIMLVIYGFTQVPTGGGVPAINADHEYFKPSPEPVKFVSPHLPEDLSFAGEKIPVELTDVREKLDREILVNAHWHSNTFLMIKRANRWFPVIEPILAENNIPDDFKYLCLIESGLTNAVSPAGATGFWQFMKTTAQGYGLEVNSQVDQRYHVEMSTEAACKYLQEAYDRYGSWSLVAASYNMGMGGVNKQLEKQQVNSYWDLLLNAETARYVYRIVAVKEIVENQEAYGFVVAEEDLYQPYQTAEIELMTPVTDLAQYADSLGINYKVLKIMNPWMRKGYLDFKNERSYLVKVPVNKDEWVVE